MLRLRGKKKVLRVETSKVSSKSPSGSPLAFLPSHCTPLSHLDSRLMDKRKEPPTQDDTLIKRLRPEDSAHFNAAITHAIASARPWTCPIHHTTTKTFQGQTAEVYSCQFSSSGLHIASAGAEKRICEFISMSFFQERNGRTVCHPMMLRHSLTQYHGCAALHTFALDLWNTYGDSVNYGIIAGHIGSILELQWSFDERQEHRSRFFSLSLSLFAIEQSTLTDPTSHRHTP